MEEPELFTCMNCRVGFYTAEEQRIHHKTEWHRYNLKRKIAGLACVTAEEFQTRMQVMTNQLAGEEDASSTTPSKPMCEACNKVFRSEAQYENHIQSKKHKENQRAWEDRGCKPAPRPTRRTDAELGRRPAPIVAEDIEDREVDLEDQFLARAIELDEETCMFCPHKDESFDANLEHMAKFHGFYVPDLEYCVDIKGLVKYLGEKVSVGNICLLCNERGRQFTSLEAVQKHMTDKGHCRIDYNADAEEELEEFYDYEDAEFMKKDPARVGEDGYELVTPSGKALGHKDFNVYYKQNFPSRPAPSASEQKQLILRAAARNNFAVTNVMNRYTGLGWTSSGTNAEVKHRRRQQRRQARERLDVGQRHNYQKHFREQVDF
eukprot:Clim_evm20s251 gene=Clim_evmTU20s251